LQKNTQNQGRSASDLTDVAASIAANKPTLLNDYITFISICQPNFLIKVQKLQAEAHRISFFRFKRRKGRWRKAVKSFFKQ